MSELDGLYQQIILDHSKLRHGSGIDAVAVPDQAAVGRSHQVNTTCGDEVTVRVAVSEGTVRQVRWDGDGCAISMASASVLADLATERTVGDLRAVIENFRELMRSRGTVEADEQVLGDAIAFAGVSRYPARIKCAMLAWVALEHALVTASGDSPARS
ncbi:MAG: SUF system NifU family Fe-S cluster assembly protein [Actinomycetota bacterium]